MLTYQDFEKVRENEATLVEFITKAINDHRNSADYKTAEMADKYAQQSGENISGIIDMLFDDKKYKTQPVVSDLFYKLNIQRVAYSLGNGITFADEKTKEKFGKKVDNVLFNAGYYSLIHKYAFLFLNYEELEMFKLTEMVPLVDMYTGALRACIRFWRLDDDHPVNVTLYEVEGYSKFEGEHGYSDYKRVHERKAYKQHYTESKAFGEKTTGGENYKALPIVRMYGSRKQQSTLVGLKPKIDMYDLVQSGFADSVATAQQVIWLFENAGGMRKEDYRAFKQSLFEDSAANVNTALDGAKVTPHQFNINTQAHESCLKSLKDSMYEDFGALDVHAISAGATNDHIDAAYQPVDLVADDFEYQIIEAVEQLLALVGVEGSDATPIFSRNKISNQREFVEMLLMCAQYLDDETIIKKLPFLTPDEWDEIEKNKAEMDMERLAAEEDEIDTTEEEAEMDNKYLTEFSDNILEQLEKLLQEA